MIYLEPISSEPSDEQPVAQSDNEPTGNYQTTEPSDIPQSTQSRTPSATNIPKPTQSSQSANIPQQPSYSRIPKEGTLPTSAQPNAPTENSQSSSQSSSRNMEQSLPSQMKGMFVCFIKKKDEVIVAVLLT